MPDEMARMATVSWTLLLLTLAPSVLARAQGDNLLGRVEAMERGLLEQGVVHQQHQKLLQQQQSPKSHSKAWWEDPALLNPALEAAEDDFQENIEKRRQSRAAGNVYKGTRDEVPFYVDHAMIPTYACPHEFRLGAWGDGGKWACLAHKPSHNGENTIVVSIGSNGDTSFELSVYKKLGVKTHTLDFSLSDEVFNRVNSLEYMKLYPLGLTEEKSRDENMEKFKQFLGVRFVNIAELVELVGAKYVDIMKVDCEGCEYGVVRDLQRLYTRSTVPYGQLLFELHFIENQELTNEFMGTMEVLGYRLFHVELNPYAAANGRYLFEVAYIHESLVRPEV